MSYTCDDCGETGIEPGDDPAETIRLSLAAARGEAIIALGLGKPVQRAEWEIDAGEAFTILKAGR